MAEIHLFSFPHSPFGQRVQIALTEKKIPFHVHMIDLKNKPQGLLEANPIHKKIPTIIHNGKPVAESVVILEYLEDAFPEQVPLMPKDAFERSKVRFWVDYIYKVTPPVSEGFKTKPGTPENQAAQEGIKNIFKTLESAMTSYSPDGPFFAGDKFGLLDVVLAPLCNFLILIENLGGIQIPGPDVLPRFHKWVETVKVCPSVSSVLPLPEAALTFFKARLAAAAPK